MFSLVKYELKGYFKDFIIILGIITILNMLLYTKMHSWPEAAIVTVSVLITFGAAIIVLIWNIKLFSRDMYEDSGYLLFTIPQNGYSVLGSKLITSIIQALIVGGIALIFNFIFLHNINLKLVISGLLNYISFLTTIYFSIALSKIAIKKRRFGKLGGFVIFVVVFLIIGKVTTIIAETFPKTFSLDALSIHSQLTLYGSSEFSINIATTIFSFILFILMFVATSYVIENKIDF